MIFSFNCGCQFKATGAALLRVILDAEGRNDFSYLEGCMRLVTRDTNSPNKRNPIFLSSGGEDYFLSASYFDDGLFKVIISVKIKKSDILGLCVYAIFKIQHLHFFPYILFRHLILELHV